MSASPNVTTASTEPVEVPRPQPSASTLSRGLFLMVVGVVLMFAGADNPLGLVGLFAVAAGALSLAFGVHKAASNLDAIAAIRYNESLRRES